MSVKRNAALALVGVLSLLTGALAVNRPVVSSPLKSYVEQAQVLEPTSYRNLSIFPVSLGRSTSSGVMPLDEAIKTGQLIVREIGEGRVNTLSVEDVGKTPVFIMAGEILEGAKQNRVLQNDVLIPAHSGRLDIGAFCVEHGRWTPQQGDDTRFKTGGLMSNPSVRAEAQVAKDQGAVWNEVENTHRKLNVPSSTGPLNEAYAAPKVQEDMSGYVRTLGDLPQRFPHMVGAVVVVGHRVLAADSFGERSLVLALWPKLIRSYALEAVSDGDGNGSVSTAMANAFLARIFDASTENQSTPGVGQLLEISGPHCSGASLVYQGWPLHLALFPRAEVRLRGQCGHERRQRAGHPALLQNRTDQRRPCRLFSTSRGSAAARRTASQRSFRERLASRGGPDG